jgi:DNA modification methylase
LPEDLKPVDFIYLDPPYFGILEEYPKNEFTTQYKEFMKAMESVFKTCIEKLKKGGKLAFIMKPINEKTTSGDWMDTTLDCCKIAERLGLRIYKRISAPLSTQQFTANNVNQVKEKKNMLNTLRDIVIFELK